MNKPVLVVDMEQSTITESPSLSAVLTLSKEYFIILIFFKFKLSKTEFWTINDDVYDPELENPQLTNYGNPPSTFLVPKDFC